jgi:hypothetical protein
MAIVSLKAHYDGATIRLDEPFDLQEGAQLMVTLLEPAQPDVQIESEDRARLAERVRRSRGIWKDRDPDAYLAASRAGLSVRDEDLGDARLVV